MEYKIGTPIPDEEIVRRFKDEDGEIFLEVRGKENELFRVIEGNRIYYKMYKTDLEEEVLILLDDFSRDHGESPLLLEKFIESRNIIEKGGEGEDEEEDEIFELDESFTFREEVAEEKPGTAIDSDYHYQAGVEEEEEPETLFLIDRVESGISTGSSAGRQKEIELEKGEILPHYLRAQCEEDIGPGGGNRVVIGGYLYFLDANYRVSQKIKISSVEDDLEDTSEAEKKADPEKPLVVKNSIANLVKTIELAIEKYTISAEYFKETVLAADNRETLISVYHGDLTQLNDDTREATDQGKKTVLERKGFVLLKAALVHELYIKSTLAGRGDNMKYFLTYLAAARPDGTLEKFQDYISLEDQEKMVEFFRTRADLYTNKTEIIKRVYRHLRANVFEEYEKLQEEGKKVRFNAYLIMKLYQQTNRLDRGYGITMIRLSRDLMEAGSIHSQ